jgi:hypothetical protein
MSLLSPLLSWVWIGVTDWLTAEIDLLLLLGGFAIEPHVPPEPQSRPRGLASKERRVVAPNAPYRRTCPTTGCNPSTEVDLEIFAIINRAPIAVLEH